MVSARRRGTAAARAVYQGHTDVRRSDMRRLLAIALPAALLLGAPAAAPAKGIMSATVCGADGCEDIRPSEQGVLGGGAPADAPAKREPFVRIDVRVGVPDHTERVRLLFLPGSELLLADDGGTWMVPMALAELRAIARQVKPFAASKLPARAPLAEGAKEASAAGPGRGAKDAAAASPGRGARDAAAADPARSAKDAAAAHPARSANDAAAAGSGRGAATAAARAPATAGSEPLAPEIVAAPAAARAASPAGDSGFDARWLALPGLAIALAVGLCVARRRRGPPASVRGTTA
jgi:hypothetical protein